jgi:RNA polymerase sigma-70 factor, ECF subfamily
VPFPLRMQPPRPYPDRRVSRADLPDEQVMSLLEDGELSAFEMIFDRHGSVAYSLAYRVCGRPAVAEEIVQEAFLSLWRCRAYYDPARGSVRSWLLRSVHNRAVDARRRVRAGGGDLAPEPGVADGQPGPELTESLVLGREEARRVRRALDDLPNEQRHVIELAYFAGLTHVEIAQRLELPMGTVKGRMRLGLQKLRVAIEPLSGPPIPGTGQVQDTPAHPADRGDAKQHTSPARCRVAGNSD